MENLDMMLFIFGFAAAAVGALLVFYSLGKFYLFLKDLRLIKKKYPHGAPWYCPRR